MFSLVAAACMTWGRKLTAAHCSDSVLQSLITKQLSAGGDFDKVKSLARPVVKVAPASGGILRAQRLEGAAGYAAGGDRQLI